MTDPFIPTPEHYYPWNPPVVRRKVGFGVECWYFPEWDQWLRFGRNKNWKENPIFSVGPLRFRFTSVHIYR